MPKWKTWLSPPGKGADNNCETVTAVPLKEDLHCLPCHLSYFSCYRCVRNAEKHLLASQIVTWFDCKVI